MVVLPRGVAFGHAKVEVYDKKEVLQRDFSGVHIHEENRVNVEQDGERSLLVIGVRGLGKFFENSFALKEEAKLAN